MNIQDIIIVLLQLTLLLIVSFWDPKMHSDMWYTLDYFFGWTDDDSLDSKHVAMSLILIFLNLSSVVCLAHFSSICLVFSAGFEEVKCSIGSVKYFVRIFILE